MGETPKLDGPCAICGAKKDTFYPIVIDGIDMGVECTDCREGPEIASEDALIVYMEDGDTDDFFD